MKRQPMTVKAFMEKWGWNYLLEEHRALDGTVVTPEVHRTKAGMRADLLALLREAKRQERAMWQRPVSCSACDGTGFERQARRGKRK